MDGVALVPRGCFRAAAVIAASPGREAVRPVSTEPAHPEADDLRAWWWWPPIPVQRPLPTRPVRPPLAGRTPPGPAWASRTPVELERVGGDGSELQDRPRSWSPAPLAGAGSEARRLLGNHGPSPSPPQRELASTAALCACTLRCQDRLRAIPGADAVVSIGSACRPWSRRGDVIAGRRRHWWMLCGRACSRRTEQAAALVDPRCRSLPGCGEAPAAAPGRLVAER